MPDIARPVLMTVDPRLLAGMAAFLVAALILLLYTYRRRVYILLWSVGWSATGTGLIMAARSPMDDRLSGVLYGTAQFLVLAGALGFLFAAWSYRSAFRIQRAHGVLLLVLFLWFFFAPLALGIRSVFAPGHLLVGLTLLGASGTHLHIIRRRAWLSAAAAPSLMLAVLAAAHLYLGVDVTEPFGDTAGRVFLILAGAFVVTGLGMQIMVFEDMTSELRLANQQLESAQSELRELAVTDSLTRCRNRRFFDEIIDKELKRHRRYRVPLTLMFVDINRFKAINDQLGHDAGDRVLQDVADFLLRNVREADYVFRWGGDEFLIMWSCREEEARRRAAMLQAAFPAALTIRPLPDGVGLSIGCVEVPSDTSDISPYLVRADELMYADKRASR